MKSIKQRIQKSTAPNQKASPKPKKKDLTWTTNDQRVWQAVGSNQPAKVAGKLSKHTNVDVNKICPSVGYSVVHYACAKGLDDCLNILLAHNADASMRDVTGATPLHAAARYGHKGTTSKLLVSRTVQVNAADNNGCTPLHFAAFEGHYDCVCLLVERHDTEIDSKDKDGRTPFMVACAMGRLQVCQELLMHGAEINVQDDKNGSTALMLASDNGHETVVRFLCENGAKLDVKTREGRTALDIAKAKKRNSVIDVLHVAQLTYAAKSSGHGQRLSSTSKYAINEALSQQKRAQSSENILAGDTYIDDLVAGTHYTVNPNVGKAQKNQKNTKPGIMKAMKNKSDKTHRGSNASSSVSTPQSTSRTQGANEMGLYTGNATGLYDKDVKYYDSASSLDGSMYSAVMSKSIDSLDNVLNEPSRAHVSVQQTAFVKMKEMETQTTNGVFEHGHSKQIQELETKIAQYSANVNQQKLKRKEEFNRNQKLVAANKELQDDINKLHDGLNQQMQMVAEQRSKYLQTENERNALLKNLDDEVSKRKHVESQLVDLTRQLSDRSIELENMKHNDTVENATRQNQLLDNDKTISSLHKTLSQTQAAIKELQQKLEKSQLFGKKSQARISELEQVVMDKQQAIEHHEIEINAAVARSKDADGKVAKLENKVIRYKNKCAEVDDKAKSLQSQLNVLREELQQNEARESEAKEDSGRIRDLEQQGHEMKNKLTRANSLNKQISEQKSIIENELGEELHRRKELERKLLDTEERIAAIEKDCDDLRDKLSSAIKSRKEAESKADRLNDEISKQKENHGNQVESILAQIAPHVTVNSGSTESVLKQLEIEIGSLVSLAKSAGQRSPRSKKLQEEKESIQAKYASQQTTVNEQNDKIEKLNKLVSSLEKNIEKKSKENEELLKKIKKQDEKIRNGSIKSTVKQLNDKMAEMEANHLNQIEALNLVVEEKQNDMNAKTEELSSKEKEIAHLKEWLEQTDAEINKLKSSNSELNLKASNKDQEVANMRTSRNKAEARAQESEKKMRSLESKKHDLEVEVNRLRQNLTDVRQRCDKMNEELTSLRKSRRDLTMRLNAKQDETGDAEKERITILLNQLEQLKEGLEASEKRHKDTIAIYRSHLLNAVKGDLDPEVSTALQEIIKQRNGSNKAHGSHI